MDGSPFIIGQHPLIQKIHALIKKVTATDATVLITGESGTGKELVARAIHTLSPRADRPFIPVNCGAIPAELLESEIFGHERGAFTGAIGARAGMFQLANGGTIFLDEVGEMSPPPAGEAPARAAGPRDPAGRRRSHHRRSTCA